MLDDFETANSLNDKAAGFEYHPDPTPYYELMCDIWKERKEYCDKVNAEKGKEKETHNTCLFFESNVIGDTGGDNTLRRMKDLNDAMNCNSYDEFEITDTPPLDEEPLSITPSFTVKKRKKKTSPSTDSVNSARETDIETAEANMQTLKKICSSLIETPDEKTDRLMNEKKTADALLLQAQNFQKFLDRNMSQAAASAVPAVPAVLDFF